MKFSALLILLLFMGSTTIDENLDSVYEYTLNNIDGEKISLKSFEGKVLLITNTASECGYTPQYEGLQKLHERYEDEGLVVIGFPANNFGGQEPGTEQEIKEFCEVNFGVDFPLSEKVSVKGKDIDPLFDLLTSKENPDFSGAIKWNFEKFLIGKDGKLLRRFRSDVAPENNLILKAIDSALNS